MKKLIVVLLVLFTSVLTIQAAEVTLNWDPNTEDDLAGYKIYQSHSSGDYNEVIPLVVTCPPLENKECTEFTISNLEDGVYFWVATAFDESGNESEFSKEVTLEIDTVAPGAPQSFTVTINSAKSVKVSVE